MPSPRTTASLLITMLACVGTVRSESVSPDWFFRAWKTEDGLPDNSISGVAQSADGHLWAGTNGGVMRFNGSRFTSLPLRNIPGLPSRQVRAMFLDRKGQLWLGMERGPVIRVGEDSFRAFSAEDGLPSKRAMSITDDPKGRTWIAFANEVVVIENDQLTRLASEQPIPSGRHASLACDSDGQVWLANDGKVGRLTTEGFELIRRFERQRVHIAPARGTGIWVSSGSILMRVDSTNEVTRTAELPRGTRVDALFEDREGAIWICTKRSGLLRVRDGFVERVATSHSAVKCVTEDLEGNIWAGTTGGGLNVIRPRTVEFIDQASGLPFSSARSTACDTSGKIWAVSQDGQLAYQAANEWHLYENTEGTGAMTCVATDAKGGIWVGTRGKGLLHLQEDSPPTRIQVGDTHRRTFIRSLHAARNGDLWIATDEPDQLSRLREGKITPIDSPVSFSAIRAIAETSEGEIWIGTSDGFLLRVQGDELIDESALDGPFNMSIRTLHATPGGSLWIGYAGDGLGHLKNGQYKRITSEEGLYDDFLSQILHDGNGSLWIAANRGLFQVGLKELLAVAADSPSSPPLRCRVYGPNDGVPSIQPSRDYAPGASRTPDNQFYFATHSGILRVFPDNIRENTQPPPVNLERVTLDGENVALYQARSMVDPETGAAQTNLSRPNPHLDLSPEHDKLVIHFAALSLASPENVRLRYRLDPIDSDWEEVGAQRSVTFPRLPAGDYQFRVIACNNAGVWNETGATLSIAVHPFLWETWWFKFGGGVFLAVVTGGLVFLGLRRKHHRQLRSLAAKRALEDERSRIARDIHDDLGASLTRITLLSQSSPSAEDHTPKPILDQIHTTARHLMRSMEEVVWAVNPEHDTFDALANYLSNYGQGFLSIADVRCRLKMPLSLPERTLSAQLRHNLFLAYKEALNNAVKHANASEVRITLQLEPESFVLKVADNGSGIDPKAPENPMRPTSGRGLANMKNRMEEIGGTCVMHSTPGQGTTVEFHVPFKISARGH